MTKNYEKGEREGAASSPGQTNQETLGERILFTLSNFAVGSHALKTEHKKAIEELILSLHLGKACAAASITRVVGYSDAVDVEAVNANLRDLRANTAVGWLTGLVSLLNRNYRVTDDVRGAPPNVYLNPNQDTPAGRADNRAVRFELTRIHLREFYQVRKAPYQFNTDQDSCGVVNAKIWNSDDFTIGNVKIKGRPTWASRANPQWGKEVVYYNTNVKPLTGFLDRIVIHHTSNNDSLDENERREQARGFAAIGYHFAIDQDGTIFEGRPLEVMGSHAGEGLKPGPMNDPDWGAIGIVLLADFESGQTVGNNFMPESPSTQMMDSLDNLIVALRSVYPLKVLAMHKEVPNRKGDPTVCPGENAYKLIEGLRVKLGMSPP